MFELIQSVPETFYSSRFYATLIRQGCGMGMGFILLNVLLGLLVLAVSLVPSLPAAERGIEDVMGRFPAITFQDQKLSMDRESPYTVSFMADPKAPVIVFDTSAQQYNVADIGQKMAAQNMVALVTSDFIALHTKDKTELYYFKDYPQLTASVTQVTHDQWVFLSHKILPWGVPLLFVALFISLFIWRMIATVVQALVVKLLALAGKVQPDFEGAMRLSAAAALPVVIVETILQIGLHTHLPFFFGALLWLGLAVFGLASANWSLKNTIT